MTLGFVLKFGLSTHKTNIRAQKIDNSALETYEIAIAVFFI